MVSPFHDKVWAQPDFVDTEQAGFLLDHAQTDVAKHVIRLATGTPKLPVEIGAQWTGKREFHWDSRTGVYMESYPLVGYDEWLIQQALVGPLVLRKRKRKNIRQ